MEQIVKRADFGRPQTAANIRRRKGQSGMTLIELMMALLVLAIGMGGLISILLIAIQTDNKNSKDTSSTLLAQMVIEQISAQHPNSSATISVTDCAGNTWNIATAGAVGPSGAGANLDTTSTDILYGGIDQTQAVANVPTGYAMQYVDCGGVNNTGAPMTYDVRWNVMTVDANYTRMVTASAKPMGATALGGVSFALPVNLRAVTGP